MTDSFGGRGLEEGVYQVQSSDWVETGVTAAQVAVLIEEGRLADGGQVFRIERANPNGSLELRGVPLHIFQTETGMFFWRSSLDAARADFLSLCELASADPPPCRAFVHLSRRPGSDGPARSCVALIYPAEFDADVARWLLRHAYAGGDTVEGGPSRVCNYYDEAYQVLERRQLWSRTSGSAAGDLAHAAGRRRA